LTDPLLGSHGKAWNLTVFDEYCYLFLDLFPLVAEALVNEDFVLYIISKVN